MRILLVAISFLLFSCTESVSKKSVSKKEMTFTEAEILEELDLSFNGVPSKYYPTGRPGDIRYNFFLDLEHGYCETAGSRIHLYADSARWVIVFEKSGYKNRGNAIEIDLNYVGNCVDYPVDKYKTGNYITNTSSIVLIDGMELNRIENNKGADMENFELVGQDVKQIKVRNNYIEFDGDYRNYEKVGVAIRTYENPDKLIGFGDLVRYLQETNPLLISATEDDITRYFPKDIPKLMTIDEFHFVSIYEESTLPSQQETYKLIAKVLTSKDATCWRPKQKPNNSWKNWESGNL